MMRKYLFILFILFSPVQAMYIRPGVIYPPGNSAWITPSIDIGMRAGHWDLSFTAASWVIDSYFSLQCIYLFYPSEKIPMYLGIGSDVGRRFYLFPPDHTFINVDAVLGLETRTKHRAQACMNIGLLQPVKVIGDRDSSYHPGWKVSVGVSF